MPPATCRLGGHGYHADALRGEGSGSSRRSHRFLPLLILATSKSPLPPPPEIPGAANSRAFWGFCDINQVDFQLPSFLAVTWISWVCQVHYPLPIHFAASKILWLFSPFPSWLVLGGLCLCKQSRCCTFSVVWGEREIRCYFTTFTRKSDYLLLLFKERPFLFPVVARLQIPGAGCVR